MGAIGVGVGKVCRHTHRGTNTDRGMRDAAEMMPSPGPEGMAASQRNARKAACVVMARPAIHPLYVSKDACARSPGVRRGGCKLCELGLAAPPPPSDAHLSLPPL